MPLSLGSRLGPYEIIAPLGAGGMGEVYRARDTRLGRDVAIKALPEAFARDPERLARFEREARLLASLSHPNIAAIYGLEEVEGRRYLVLEYVEGQTLAEHLARGRLPADEALEVCRQIAAGVEAAHEASVVHRDLKPGNVKLTPTGQVKVLDFGLARSGATASTSSNANLSASPTVTDAATSAGVILGTAAYMSPEQARGKAVDRRTDVWSFGCVLYECLAGRPLYEGETVSDLIAKILEREPDWRALPATTPARVRDLLRRCLRKDPKERLRDIGDARLELIEAQAGGEEPAGPAPTVSRANERSARTAWTVAGLLAAVLVVMAVWLVPRAARPGGEVTRLSIAPPVEGALAGDPGTFAISPDGRLLAFALADTSGVTRLWVRPLANPECRAIDGTDGASFPFWSPDSRHVAFFADGKLKRVPATGGAVQTLCDARTGRGGAWSPRGVIVFAPEPSGPLLRVDASGGPPAAATVLDHARGETSHRFPSFLPDGRHFLYGTLPGARGDLNNTCVASLDDPTGKPLVQGRNTAQYAPPNYLVFSRDQALMAQRLDLGRLKMIGEPVLLPEQPIVVASITMSPVTSSSAGGILVYGQDDRRPTDLRWLSRDGRRLETMARHPGMLITPQVSPSGDRLAATELGIAPRSWIFDLDRGTGAALPVTDGSDWTPIWSPDGRGIACLNQTPGVNTIVYRDAGTGSERVLAPATPTVYREPAAWSPDGRFLLVSELVKGHQRDLLCKTLGDTAAPRTWVGTPAEEEAATFSHDGRWVAYVSDASGRRELLVDAFPEPRGPHRVSPSGTGAIVGPSAAWWRNDDHEIYFLGPDGNSVFACEIRTGPEIVTGEPHMLFSLPPDTRGVAAAPDGDRFLLLLPVGQRAPVFTVVQNWTRALQGEK